MNVIKSVVGKVAAAVGIPTSRVNWLSPRYEPINISATATVQSVQTAIRSAENGETRELFRFYRDALLGDDHIQGEINKRKLAVIGQPMAILPAEKENEEDLRAAAACLRAVADCENWNPAMGALLSGSQWPVVVAENVFQPAEARPVRYSGGERTEDGGQRTEDGGRRTEDGAQRTEETAREFALQYTLKRIEAVNPMLFCFRHAYLVGGVGMGTGTPEQIAGLSGGQRTEDGGQKAGEWWSINLGDWEPFLRLWPIDEQGRVIYDASRATSLDTMRHIVHRGHLLTEHRDNWGGPMRAILFWWLLRGLGRDWFARFMERYGSPFPVGRTNVQDAEAVSFLKEAFSLSTKVGGLVIGQDDQVELKEAVVQGGAEGHRIWQEVCNNAISRHITGYDSNSKPGGLNAGESTAQENVRSDIRIFDGKMLGETLQKQLFARFLRFNGLMGQVRVVFGGLSTRDAKVFAELLKTTSEAGFEPTDEAIPTLEEKLGFPVQRKVALDLIGGFSAGELPPGEEEEDENEDGKGGSPKMFRARRVGRLVRLHSQAADPLAQITARRVAALADSYKGVMAPFRQIILSSNSKEECLRRLSVAYRDWKPERLTAELEAALQACAAAGAKKAVETANLR